MSFVRRAPSLPGATPDFSRRAVLRLLLTSALACAGRGWAADPHWLSPVTPAPRSLRDIGPLCDSGVDGIRIPRGFGLRRVARHMFNPLTDRFDPFGLAGYARHKSPDGGACFAAPDGGWVYVSNCESKSAGGVGALRFAADGAVTDAYRILDGTRRNCSGGATPWGTWLSCEEMQDGEVFECDPFERGANAGLLPALGRFNHEAAAVHLHSRSVFLTEDAEDGRFYHFVADGVELSGGRERLDLGRGRLQVLEVEGCEQGGKLPFAFALPLTTRWVDAIDPQSPQSEVRATLAATGRAAPGTVFRGAEGVWVYEPRLLADGGGKPAVAFVSCKGDNRIYALDLDHQTLEPVFDGDEVNPPVREVDNLVVGPRGELIVAEDGPGTRLVVVRPGQPPGVLVAAGHAGSEITGPAFSPDGRRLYFSSQRGPNLGSALRGTGVTYELMLPT